MPKVRYYAVLAMLVCMGLSVPAHAQCWRWVETQGPSGLDLVKDTGYLLAFDEGRGLPALLLAHQNYQAGIYYQQLWHYVGKTWTKTWEGEIITPYYGRTLDTYIGLYCDRVRNSLVLIGGNTWGGEMSSVYAYEYKGAGWELLAEYFPASGGRGLAYDSDRKRAVIYGLSFVPNGGWLEFDGEQFYVFEEPVFLRSLCGGSSGYDPAIRRVVYRGYYDTVSNDIKSFEYDGMSWTEVETPHTLPGEAWSPGKELCYLPQLGGLLAKPNEMYVLPETWIYKDHDWQKLSLDAELFSDFYVAFMTYDPIREVVILLGLPAYEPYDPLTWEMRRTGHCRPVYRP